METSDPDAKTGNPPRAAAPPGHTHERDGLTVKVRTNGDHDHVAATGRRRRRSLARVRGPNTAITAEVAVKAGSERKGVRKC